MDFDLYLRFALALILVLGLIALLAWLLRRSPVMLPIPGTSSIGHLEENFAAAKLKLSKEDLAALD